MKLRAHISILLLSLFTGCGVDDYVPPEISKVFPNMDIGDVGALYSGAPVVNGDVIIAGRVTANDLSGNFYRSFVIEDASGAIEVRAGLYDLKNLFPCGRYVAVRARGLTVGMYNGVLQIGLAPSGGSQQVGYFDHRAMMDRYVYRGELSTPISPAVVTVATLTDDLCGRLVSISGLTLNDGEEGVWAILGEYASNSFRMFSDDDHAQIAVVTSGYADFAGSLIPQGALRLTGILMKGATDRSSETYMLKLRTLDDVAVE